jgi:hypothetical protein
MVQYGSYIEPWGRVIALFSEWQNPPDPTGEVSTSHSLIVLSNEQVTNSRELLWAQSIPYIFAECALMFFTGIEPFYEAQKT